MRIAAATIILSLAACAQAPDAIAPAAMPADLYAGLSCPAARDAHAAVSAVVADLENRQRRAASGDAWSVFLIGLPVSGVTGSDRAGDLAEARGRQLALEARLSRC